jgi:hypothetical protein
MEAAGSSEMLVTTYQTTRRYIPDDNHHSIRRGILKSRDRDNIYLSVRIDRKFMTIKALKHSGNYMYHLLQH